jgi:CxxC motif-containing protein
METKNLTCIVCPLGCAMTAQMDGGKVVSISGNTCKRGESYARAELTDPRRTLTTTMRVKGGGLVSVKSKDTLPKGKLFDCMTVINAGEAQTPVEIGDVLIKDIMGLGVDIVATSRVKGV